MTFPHYTILKWNQQPQKTTENNDKNETFVSHLHYMAFETPSTSDDFIVEPTSRAMHHDSDSALAYCWLHIRQIISLNF